VPTALVANWNSIHKTKKSEFSVGENPRVGKHEMDA
jgi:hypothetical protein